MVETRPKIAFATSVLSQFAKNNSWQQKEEVKTIIRYLKATRTIEIMYGRDQEGELIIKGYSDSDLASDQATRKSTSGFIFILKISLLSWCFQRQAMVALSLTKTKYMALIFDAKEAIWLRLLPTKIGLLDEEGQYEEIKVK